MPEYALAGFMAVILLYVIGYGYGAIVSIIKSDDTGRG